MKYIADALTVLRFVCAAIIAVAIALFGAWHLAMWFTATGALSDAFDGMAARKWKLKPGEKGNDAFDEAADAVFCGVLVFAPALRLILARVNGWQDGWVPLWFSVSLLVVEMFLTPFFLLATAKLEPKRALRADIAHGIHTAALMVGSLVLVTFMALDVKTAALTTGSIFILSCYIWGMKSDRLTSRPGKVYHGTLTWAQFLTGRWAA